MEIRNKAFDPGDVVKIVAIEQDNPTDLRVGDVGVVEFVAVGPRNAYPFTVKFFKIPHYPMPMAAWELEKVG